MKKFYFHFGIAFATFLIGSLAATLYFRRAETASPAPVSSLTVTMQAPPATPSPTPPALCPPVAGSKKKLEAADAVRLAECFIIKNGYTDLPPTEDKSELTPEAVWAGTDDYGMRMRRDSLERTAFGYLKGFRYPDDWLVVFRIKYKAEYAGFPGYEESLKTRGRVVSMDAYGRKLRVEHQDFNLGFPGLTKLSTEIRTGN